MLYMFFRSAHLRPEKKRHQGNLLGDKFLLHPGEILPLFPVKFLAYGIAEGFILSRVPPPQVEAESPVLFIRNSPAGEERRRLRPGRHIGGGNDHFRIGAGLYQGKKTLPEP